LGLDNHGFRYYDPEVGRYISRDPIGYGDGLNVYLYVHNNPINDIDPLGLWGVQFGDFNIGIGQPSLIFRNDAEMRNALRGGVSVTASTLTYGLTDKANLTQSGKYHGAEFTASRVLATVSREALVTAATAGIGQAAQAGNATAQLAQKGLLAYEAGSGGYDVGSGTVKIAQGETKEGAIQMLGGALRVAGSVANARALESPPEGIVYKRTDPVTGEEYVGQAKSPQRFDARQTEHDKALGVQHEYQELGRAKPVEDLDVLEETKIRELGGLKKEGGTLVNKRHQMSEERYRAAGGTVDDPTK
jgi:uncharacterized protein RhaS with RHS repeats